MSSDVTDAKVRIDNVDYQIADLPAEVRAQLASIQAVDRRIAHLQEEMAILQTARSAYANAVKSHVASLN